MEDILVELESGMSVIDNKLVYVDVCGELRTVKIFDLVTHEEKIYFYENLP